MAVTVNIHEAKTHLSRLLEQVASGEHIVIAKAGVPVADLIPHRRADIVVGSMKGEIVYDDDEFDRADLEIGSMFDGALEPDAGDAAR